MANNAYESIGRLFSRRQMRQLGSLLDASGSSIVPEAFAGFMVLSCILLSIISYSLMVSLAPLRSVAFRLALFMWRDLALSTPAFASFICIAAAVLLSCTLACLIAYVALSLKADSRRRKVEEVLPDFLSLSAANVRAGMTIDQAMWYAAKPEFGILSDEVAIVAKRTFGGVPFNQSIDHLSERFSSKSMRRTVSLIKQGIASGGKVADILERTAEESRQLQTLRKEISTSLLMYVIFIVFAGAIGTPFLFSISAKLVGMVEGLFSTLPASSSAASPGVSGPLISPSQPAVSSADFLLFTVLSTLLTAVFSSLIIGVISRGSKREGVTYIPILVAMSLAVFLLVGAFLDNFLSNIAI